jgi:pseudaminic acid cytidylyltransferase
MSNNKGGPCRRVAIIPARGGSKRIPRKNIRPFHGKPIIQWVIEIAQTCECFDSVVVSTDDQEIASVAKAAGAQVPFLRPAALGDDYTPTVDVIAHTLQALHDLGQPYEQACCLYPTSVFVSKRGLNQGLALLEESNCSYVMSIMSYAHPIERALRMESNGSVSMDNPHHAATRSQDLVPAYHDAAQFYWGKASAWLSHEPILSGRTKAVVLNSSEAQDIDNETDWLMAEQLFAVHLRQNTMKEAKQ